VLGEGGSVKLKFCSQCGNLLAQRVPDNDNRPRYICDHCDTIHYQNPRMVVGCLPSWQDKVLLCKRAIEPRRGFWTLPAGFMENGETTLAGALRETLEEADARVDKVELYRLFDLPHINQVYIFYRAELVGGKFGVGPESLETRLFAEDEIPWRELAFPIVGETLTDYFEERRGGGFSVRISAVDLSWWKKLAVDPKAEK
jgi:ADP-ribose pyrophosphatase YjhB (NUDIX family)